MAGRDFKILVLGYGDFLAQVNVLNGVKQLDAVCHGALKCFAPGNKTSTAGTFVDNGGFYGLG